MNRKVPNYLKRADIIFNTLSQLLLAQPSSLNTSTPINVHDKNIIILRKSHILFEFKLILFTFVQFARMNVNLDKPHNFILQELLCICIMIYF